MSKLDKCPWYQFEEHTHTSITNTILSNHFLSHESMHEWSTKLSRTWNVARWIHNIPNCPKLEM